MQPSSKQHLSLYSPENNQIIQVNHTEILFMIVSSTVIHFESNLGVLKIRMVVTLSRWSAVFESEF